MKKASFKTQKAVEKHESELNQTLINLESLCVAMDRIGLKTATKDIRCQINTIKGSVRLLKTELDITLL